jgi:hypothetical protein
VKTCGVCQRNKTEHLHPAGLLQPLPVPSSVWSDNAMDFVEGFPKVGGKSIILTVVDRFSNTPILFLSAVLIQQVLWPKLSLMRLFTYMGSLVQLSVTGIRCSLVFFEGALQIGGCYSS